MNISNVIFLERQSSKENTAIGSNYTMPKYLFLLNRYFGRALCTISIVFVIAFLVVLSSSALGANPAEELASSGIRNSFCGCSSALAWQWAVHMQSRGTRGGHRLPIR